MKDIMKLMFFQLKKSKLFWAMFALSFLIPMLIILILSLGLLALGGRELVRLFPITPIFLREIAGIGSSSGIFALITSSVVLSSDFASGTMRNVILANKSRKTMYFSYLFVSLIVGVIFLFCHFAAIMIFAAPIFGFNGIFEELSAILGESIGVLSGAQICGSVFLSLFLGILSVCFVQSSVCMFLFCIRKQWATIVFPLMLIVLVPYILTIASTMFTLNITSIIDILGGSNLSMHVLFWTPFVNISLYYPTLHYFIPEYGELITAIVLYYVLFTSVFVISGYFVFKKADLK